MKSGRITAVFAFLACTLAYLAQNHAHYTIAGKDEPHVCGSDMVHERAMEFDTQYRLRFEDMERDLRDAIANSVDQRNPVVYTCSDFFLDIVLNYFGEYRFLSLYVGFFCC